MRQVSEPFEDLGMMRASAGKSRRLGGTDSTSFNQAGLPGVSVSQDPIEYFTDTWHTSADTYERILEDDAKSSAIVIAAAVYQLEMRDSPIPGFSKEEMPAPSKPEADTPPAPARATGN